MRHRSELERLRVYGETEVGWDRNKPPNETIDEEMRDAELADHEQEPTMGKGTSGTGNWR